MHPPHRIHAPIPLSAAAALALAALLVQGGCARQDAAAAPTPAPKAVRTVPVTRGPLRETLRYVGTIGSRREMKILARVPGTLAALPLREGEAARKGQVLARLAVPENTARVHRLGAEVSRARTERSFLCRRYDTDQKLAREGAVTGSQLDASRRACQSARAAASAAAAALSEGRSNVDKAVEKAPFHGRVLDWLAEPGQHVMPGQPLVRFGDDALEVRVAVSEEDIHRGIRTGTPVRVGGDHGLEATVTSVGVVAGGPARTVEVRIHLPIEAFENLAQGMSVDVAFVLAEDGDASSVPRRALARTDEGTFVFAVRDDRLERLRVTTGLSADGRVAIEPRPPAGTRVAVGDLRGLRDGAAVYAVGDRERAQ